MLRVANFFNATGGLTPVYRTKRAVDISVPVDMIEELEMRTSQ